MIFILNRLFAATLILFFLGSCNREKSSSNFGENLKNPWNHLDFKNDYQDFQFAIVSDRTAYPTLGVFTSAVEKINLLQPDFVMSIGDFVTGYTFQGKITDMTRMSNEWDSVTTSINTLSMPFFYTVGNNDFNSEEASSLWEDRFGKTYYHFVYKNSLFLVLNSDDPTGGKQGNISDEQLLWLSTTLQKFKEIKWTFLFMHRPLWNNPDMAEWIEIKNLLSDRKYTFFAGHLTQYNKKVIDGNEHFTLASTGSFSKGNVPPADDFDHIAWVTMNSDKPIVANLMLNGIWGDDPVLEAKKAN